MIYFFLIQFLFCWCVVGVLSWVTVFFNWWLDIRPYQILLNRPFFNHWETSSSSTSERRFEERQSGVFLVSSCILIFVSKVDWEIFCWDFSKYVEINQWFETIRLIMKIWWNGLLSCELEAHEACKNCFINLHVLRHGLQKLHVEWFQKNIRKKML